MIKEITNIYFENVQDFRKRICSLWQNQKPNETYEFEFGDEESKSEFEN